MNLIDYFTDPVLRGPTIGSMLMCMVAGLVGVLVFVRRRSLLGEALSHATYPGVTGAIVIAALFSIERALPFMILSGAALSAFAGYWLINVLERRLRVTADAALCAVLALFFGLGITIASFAQTSFSSYFRKIQAYLYGQAATMSDIHIVLYTALAVVVIGAIILFYKEILALAFDRAFATSLGLPMQGIRILFISLVILSVVISIRSVGVILMSAMFIAPATAARQFTNRLSRMFMLSGAFGALSGLVGILLSTRYALPTGPTIVLVAGTCAFYALLFAPDRGLVMRYMRAVRFRTLQREENLLKALWRLHQKGEQEFDHSLLRLRLRGWVTKVGAKYRLTPKGLVRGGQIVRLHRLWEVYLVSALGLGVERVHTSAEEMEHILTPELEQRLTKLLDDPKHDPHEQPIPSRAEVMRT